MAYVVGDAVHLGCHPYGSLREDVNELWIVLTDDATNSVSVYGEGNLWIPWTWHCYEQLGAHDADIVAHPFQYGLDAGDGSDNPIHLGPPCVSH